jgi:hypothetical protein
MGQIEIFLYQVLISFVTEHNFTHPDKTCRTQTSKIHSNNTCFTPKSAILDWNWFPIKYNILLPKFIYQWKQGWKQ